ncbi:MAG: SDR family NAD(P)-dependent oxidoreductase [Clostridiaceae bacterium]
MKNYTLITGATSGIGLELVHLAAKDKKNLILIARNQSELIKIKELLTSQYSIEVHIIVKDLKDNNSAEEIYKEIDELELNVDELINNAGVGSFGSFNDINKDIDLDMINVNIYSLTYLIKLVLPKMIENNKGKILNVASTAAFMPGPFMAVYYASKSYVLLLSEALASELKNTNVTVSVLCPGPTKTNFQSRAKMKKSDFVKAGVMDAKTVARMGYEGMKRGKRVIIPGVVNKSLITFMKFMPRTVAASLVKITQNSK